MTSSTIALSRSINKCVADIIAEERQLTRELTLNSIQMERTVETFAKRVTKLASERDNLQNKITSLKKELEKHSLLAELCSLPPELASFVSNVVPPSLAESLFAEEVPKDFFHSMAIRASDIPKVDHLELQFCLRNERILTQSNPKSYKESGQGRLQQLHHAHENANCAAFLPVARADGGIEKRPATADLTICESSVIDMGRVIVTKRPYGTGDLLLLEHPFLTLITDKNKVVLTHEYSDILSRVVDQQAVFTAKGWDQRLAVAFVSYLCELHESPLVAKLSAAVAGLSCPLGSIDADKLSSICEFAHFLHAALPSSLQEQHSEDIIVAFCVSFQTNAIAHGHSNFSLIPSVQGAIGEEGKHSLFAFTSLIQHSCHPNAALTVRSLADIGTSTGQLEIDGYVVEVRALRPIGVGEALSISYCNLLPPTSQRRRTLRARYYFDCMCARCTDEADFTRRFINSEDYTVAAIGEGVRWLVDAAVSKRADDPLIVTLLKMEGIFVEKVNNTSPSDIAAWRSLLLWWQGTNVSGYCRLAPEHYAVVTCACMFAACVASSETVEQDNEILLHYCATLLARLVAPSSAEWLTDDSAPEAIASFDFSATPDPFIVSTCVLPVTEGVAQSTRGVLSAKLWYLSASILAKIGFVTSDRLLRAKLMALPLIGQSKEQNKNL